MSSGSTRIKPISGLSGSLRTNSFTGSSSMLYTINHKQRKPCFEPSLNYETFPSFLSSLDVLGFLRLRGSINKASISEGLYFYVTLDESEVLTTHLGTKLHLTNIRVDLSAGLYPKYSLNGRVVRNRIDTGCR